jgi:hypothetical protein
MSASASHETAGTSAWNPNWGDIPADKRQNLFALAYFCNENPDVLGDTNVLYTASQFLLPRTNFPYDLPNRDELMEYVGLGKTACIDAIQADPVLCLKVIAVYATCPCSKWGSDDRPSSCSTWPIDMVGARLLARAITKAAVSR